MSCQDKATANGVTLDKCIQSGVDNPGVEGDCAVGIVAGDKESYSNFAPIFDPIIEELHNGYAKEAKHPTDLDCSKLTNAEFDSEYVVGCRLKVGRNIKGFCLPPSMSRLERRTVERAISDACAAMGGDFKGSYMCLKDLSAEVQTQMIGTHMLFPKITCPHKVAAGVTRDWPDARGMYHNGAKNFAIWVNEEDHSGVISMQMGGNMKEVFSRFSEGFKGLEAALKKGGKEFMRCDHLGHIVSCPSRLGTALVGGARVKLPKVAAHAQCAEMLKAMKLQKSQEADGCCNISNLETLGTSELEQVQCVVDGIQHLIKIEKALAAGESTDDLIAQALSGDVKPKEEAPKEEAPAAPAQQEEAAAAPPAQEENADAAPPKEEEAPPKEE